MCVLCVEYEKGKMTTKELLNNIGEIIDSEKDESTQQHLLELADKAISKDMPFENWDEDNSVFGMLDELDYGFMPDED